MYKYGIVVIGYKNAEGVRRLLDALEKADYEDENPLLIISIDYSGEDNVFNEANSFQWTNGEKVVKRHTNRQGLRNHVLACGDYINEYGLDALVVFEDDMMPSRDFFHFTRQATEKYIDNDNIAGISLYTHCVNFNVNERFVPINNGKDNYFFQCAQSRGQVWFRKQWNDFKSWYADNSAYLEGDVNIPWVVACWPDTSWLKYHIKYCIEKNKYFVYPYISFSTCFGDVGEHVKVGTNSFQVPLSSGGNREFDLAEFDDKAVRYNAFFENEDIYKWCGVKKDELTVDLYGVRMTCSTKYLLTRKSRPYKIIKSWGDCLIPHEMNIFHDIEGEKLFLYDTEENSERCKVVPDDKIVLYGSGGEGRRWLQRLGNDRVYGFADSDSKKAGNVVYGKRIYSLEELKELRGKVHIFISANAINKNTILHKLKQENLDDMLVGSPFYFKNVNVDTLAIVDADTEFEGRNAVLHNSEISDTYFGYASYVSSDSHLSKTRIGRFSCIGPNVNVVAGQHPTHDFVSVSPLFYSEQKIIGEPYVSKAKFGEFRYTKRGYRVEIGNDVWIGANVTLMEGITIADGTIIAAGANVVKDTEPYSIIGGNPARIIKYRFPEEDVEFLLDLKWWNYSEEWLKSHAELFTDIERLKMCKKIGYI